MLDRDVNYENLCEHKPEQTNSHFEQANHNTNHPNRAIAVPNTSERNPKVQNFRPKHDTAVQSNYAD